ncbi:MAG TPA: NF038122 family metalloprotease [Phenylobacterium sp.]|nr:NF038122 family metalloprotease [Phenylobacterium sp.]
MRIPPRRLPAAIKAQLFGACAMALVAATAAPSHALTIIPHFDTSITSLSNAAAIQSAFNAVAHDYAISFNNPATVNVNVSWGSVAGQALPSNAVGASVSNLYGYFSYGQIRNDLTSFSAANPSDTSLATAVKYLPQTTPAGPTRYVVPSAEAKALGLISPTQNSLDGSIGFAGSTSGYDFSPANGVTAGAYDFQAVAAHELAEVLGRISGISSTSPVWRTPFDLYRYSAPGVLDYGYNDAAYFSINGGLTDLKDFNNSSSGGDRGDWATLTSIYDVSNAFISTGHPYNLTAVDLTALDVLGWGGTNLGNTGVGAPGRTAFSLITGVPEPSQWALMLVGFGLTGAALRRRRALRQARVRIR